VTALLRRLANRRGQATTEVVLMFPIFMIILFAIAKIFALLVVVQKMEIASYYAARRWQLESHRNSQYESSFDNTSLRLDIQDKIQQYIGVNNAQVKKFLGLKSVNFPIPVRTQVWNIVTIQVTVSPSGLQLFCKYPVNTVCASYASQGAACANGYNFICSSGKTFEVTKYVPNRDRPIQFELPGLQ
jgi:Flp pilus assembly protein TadG